MKPAVPQTLAVKPENIPAELKTGPRFVVWRWLWKPEKQRWTKPPVDTKTGRIDDATNPDIWTDFETALEYARNENLPGVGIVLTGDGLTAIDLDHCFTKTGELTPKTQETVDRFDTYTERSPSGTGIRMLLYGKLPGKGRKKDHNEVYDQCHYVTLTGQLYGEPRPIAERQDVLDQWHEEVFGTTSKTNRQNTPPERQNRGQSVCKLSDEEILTRVNPNAYAANSSYPSESERDLAFLSEVAFYAGAGNTAQIENVWRASGLWREKCEREDYVTRTIAKAFNGKHSFYGDRRQPQREAVNRTPAPVSGGSQTDGETVCITVAELEALHAKAAKADRLEAELAKSEAEKKRLRALTARTAGIRQNQGLRTAKDTATAVVFNLAARKESPDERGFYPLLYPQLAESAGCGTAKVASDLKKFAGAGLLDLETRSILFERPNPETGELLKTPERRVYVKPANGMTPVELAEQFATVDLKTNYGGKREPRICPTCKIDAGSTITHTETCNGCGNELAVRQTKRKPGETDFAQESDRKHQVGGYAITSPPVVVVPKLHQVGVYDPDELNERTKFTPKKDAGAEWLDRNHQFDNYESDTGETAKSRLSERLLDRVRDNSPEAKEARRAAWYERENENRRWIENSIAVGGD